MTATATSPVLSMTGIGKRFGAVQALKDVAINVHPGEVVALVGDNGAGKSTLVKIMAGVYTADEGEMVFDGKPVTINGPKQAQDLGIATVFQDLALCDNLDVVANLYLGQEHTTGGSLDEVEMEKRSWELLRQLSAKIPSVRITIASLSGGQRQTVAIARSLVGDPKVVMLISHNMADVQAVADRIYVLRLGQNGAEFSIDDVTTQQLVAAITGASDNVVSQRAARGEQPLAPEDIAPDDPTTEGPDA
jgi:D-xylose transport system ATP-binding protein